MKHPAKITIAPLHGVHGRIQQASYSLMRTTLNVGTIQNGNSIFLLYSISSNTVTRALAFARIESHFFINQGWMEDGQLIKNANKIAHLPIVIIQGRYDMVCPAKTSWDFYQALGGSKNDRVEYKILADCGHSAHEKGMEEALVDACEKFKTIKKA
jgi:pimeloyl-ACP methyl ester carboxylesterase